MKPEGLQQSESFAIVVISDDARTVGNMLLFYRSAIKAPRLQQLHHSSMGEVFFLVATPLIFYIS